MSLSSTWTAVTERVTGTLELVTTFNAQVLQNLLYLYSVKGGHGGLQAAFASVDVTGASALLGTIALDRVGFWTLEIVGAAKATADYRGDDHELQAAISSAATLGTANANVVVFGPASPAGVLAGLTSTAAEISFYAKILYEVTAQPQTVTAWCLHAGGTEASGVALCRGRFIATFQGKAD